MQIQNQTELNHLPSNQTHILLPMPPAALPSTQEDLLSNLKGFAAIVLCGCSGSLTSTQTLGKILRDQVKAGACFRNGPTNSAAFKSHFIGCG